MRNRFVLPIDDPDIVKALLAHCKTYCLAHNKEMLEREAYKTEMAKKYVSYDVDRKVNISIAHNDTDILLTCLEEFVVALGLNLSPTKANHELIISTVCKLAANEDSSHCVDLGPIHMLHKAATIVQGGRNSDHKDAGPGQSFEVLVPMFNQLTGHNLSIGDGVTFMMLLKLVRDQIDPKEDNKLDLAGYSSIKNDIDNAEKKD